MSSFPLQYGQSIYITVGPGGWLGGLTSPIGGDCSSCNASTGGNNQTNGVITNVQTQLPDEFVILDSNGNNPGGPVNYQDSVTVFNKTQNSFWLVNSGCMYMSSGVTTGKLVIGLTSMNMTQGPIQVPIFPSTTSFQDNQIVCLAPGGLFVNALSNGTGTQAMILCNQQNSILSFALVEAPPPPAPPSPTPYVPMPPPPQVISIQSSFTGTYLTVCGECNNIPGISVDVHASSPSQQAGSLWQLINAGPDLVGILNTLTGTYLTVYEGMSVNVQATSIGQSIGSEWKLSSSGILNTLTNTYLSVCSGCPVNPSGISVDVHSSIIASYSSWVVSNLSPLPTPMPYGPSSGGGGGEGGGNQTSKDKWIFWLGIGLWITGTLLTIGIPAGYLALRLISVIMGLAGIGLIFYMSF